ncbi:MAG: response regulator [Gemella sp.]|nr:response regulator [Gemella sp.]
MKVLIVDDSGYYRERGADIQRDLGNEVFFAKDGYEAIAEYRRVKPDVVTMDICMPNLDGLDATKEIVKDDPNAIIMICSSAGHIYKNQAYKNGAQYILKKEYDEYDFKAALYELDLIKEM